MDSFAKALRSNALPFKSPSQQYFKEDNQIGDWEHTFKNLINLVQEMGYFVDTQTFGSRSQYETMLDLPSAPVSVEMIEAYSLLIENLDLTGIKVPEETVLLTLEPLSDTELDWVEKNLSELSKTFAGEWIAVSGNEIVAHGANIEDVKKTVIAKKVKAPFVKFIPAQGELSPIIIV